MSYKHRSTPVVHAPALGLTAPERGHARDLRAPVVVVAAGGEWELDRGILIIGRGAEASIPIEDPLVSRQHARLSVLDNGNVVVEDLHSTNGVFINGVRLVRPTAQLREGDRLLVGTTEISVFTNQHSGQIPLRRRANVYLEELSSAPQSMRMPALLHEPVQRAPQRAPSSGTAIGAIVPVPSTQRADGFSLVRNVADRLMASGQPAEAVQVLSEHLNNILLGASNGLSAQPYVLEHAARCAVKLYHWTRRSSWLDYIFELHLVCSRAPSSVTLDLLDLTIPSATGIDRELIRYLVQGTRDRVDASQDELLCVDRLEKLIPA